MAAASAVAVVEVEAPPQLDGGWRLGPAPVNAQVAGPVREREWRATYFERRAARRLHGTPGDRPAVVTRWHAERPPAFAGALAAAGTPTRLELLAIGPLVGGAGESALHGSAPYLLSIHVDLSREDPVAAVGLLGNVRRAGLPQPEGPLREWIAEATNLTVPHAATDAFTVAMVTFDDPTPDQPGPFSVSDRRLFHLASGTPWDRFPLHPDARDELLSTRILLSADWEALVLRDGAAFVGLVPEAVSDFLRGPARSYVHSIYLDAFLLGLAQRQLLAGVADALADLGSPVRHPRELAEIEERMTTFRNEFWWQHVTVRSHATELLRGYRAQHRLDEFSDQLTSEIADYSAQVQTAASAQLNAFVGVLAVVGLPFAVGMPVLDLLAAPDWLVIFYVVVAVLAIAGVLSRPPVRRRMLWPLRALFT